MFKNRINSARRLYRDQAGDGGDPGSGGQPTITPEMQAIIDKATDAAVAGLKAKNGELHGKLKEQAESLKRYDGIDPDAVRNILQKFASDEEAALIAKGDIDTVLTKRTERMKGEYDKQLKAAQDVASAADARAQRFTDLVLENAIRAAATSAGLHTHAVDDAVFRAKTMFSLSGDGEAVALGDDGKPLLGKDARAPLTVTEWLEGMKDKAPHWWPAGSGGGAGNGGGGGSSAPKSLAECKTDAERVSYLQRASAT